MSQVPAIIGRYQVERLLGEGGMGVLYLARDPVLDRHVALKLLRVNGEDLRRRFMREAQSAARLQHPNIVTVYDVGDHEGELYIAMEYIDGDTLATLIRDEVPFSPIRKLDIIDEVADGLGFAHQRGIIHRDIKPANLMIARAGLVKVLDFGIARLSHRDSAEIDSPTLIGTPAYMAPEQLEGAEVDARSDIYAVGLVMYELFSGRRAFAGATTADVLQQVLSAQPTPIERLVAHIDPDLATVIGRAMARQPADRYPDLQSMRKDLARARRRAMQASGDDATVVVGVPVAGGGALAMPPRAATVPATVVPPAASTSTLSGETLYAPLSGTLPPPPPPLPATAPVGPLAGSRPQLALPDDGPLPVPLPSVPSSGGFALPDSGRSTVDAPVLAAVRDSAIPGRAAGEAAVHASGARIPGAAAPPPVAPLGMVHSSGALATSVPTARRGVSATLIVGGLLAMLGVCFMAAFMAARSFGLLGGAPIDDPTSRTATPESVPPAELEVPDRAEPLAGPVAEPVPVPGRGSGPAATPSTAEAPVSDVPVAPAVTASSTPRIAVQKPTAVAQPVTRPALPPSETRRPVQRSTPLRAPDAAPPRPPSPVVATTPPSLPPPRDMPARPPVVADAPPLRPVERREPDPPPVVAPQSEGLALVRAYVAARNTAHASGIRRVWPGVDDNHLRRVTSSFSAPLTLADCEISPRDDARAVATCRLTQPGTTEAYAPGQGLTIRRTFVFDLAREGRTWVIAGLRE